MHRLLGSKVFFVVASALSWMSAGCEGGSASTPKAPPAAAIEEAPDQGGEASVRMQAGASREHSGQAAAKDADGQDSGKTGKPGHAGT